MVKVSCTMLNRRIPFEQVNMLNSQDSLQFCKNLCKSNGIKKNHLVKTSIFYFITFFPFMEYFTPTFLYLGHYGCNWEFEKIMLLAFFNEVFS